VLNLDPAKLLVILVIALVVLGPERLPKAARQLATAFRTLTHLREQVTEEVRRALPDVELPTMRPSGFVAGLFADATRPGERRSPAGDAERSRAPDVLAQFTPDDPTMN
jgi:sec-independent protein translocase protein TatB